MRINLVVPYADKDVVKKLGARWDGNTKCWFITSARNIDQFSQWIPSDAEFTIRSSSYYIAKNTEWCWQCGTATSVFALITSRDCSIFEEDEWESTHKEIIVSFVNGLPQDVRETIQKASGFRYSWDLSKTTEGHYYMNHCQHCAAKLGDFFMHNEPGGPFFPSNDSNNHASISVEHIQSPFACSAGMYGDFWQ